MGSGWPELTVASWQPTRDTLHMWTQIVGKVRLALEPMVNHWWQVPLYVSGRGLTTSLMHAGDKGLEMEFDFVDHVLHIRTTRGELRQIVLKPQSVADFYKGKALSIVVGSSTGGGYDAMARAIARFIGKHLPGNPFVVVRNMPGAGGIAAMNHLYNAAEKDGTIIGMVQNNTPLEPLFGTKEARYDPVKFN